MKKIYIIAVIVITAFCMSKLYNMKTKSNPVESRGIFISYIECLNHLKNKSEIETKSEINNIIDNVKKYHFNRIYLQVRPFSDSI